MSHASNAGKCIFFHHPGDYMLCAAQDEWKRTMRIASKLKTYLENRRAIRELSALDDRALSDLGISRYNLRAAVEGSR